MLTRHITMLASTCLISGALLFRLANAQGPTTAPGPAFLEVANQTVFVLAATCYGTGVFSGEGTAESTPGGFFRTPGGSWSGLGLVSSTTGVWNGTGYCDGDAQFNITKEAPAELYGSGTVTGDGIFTLATGTFDANGTFQGTDIGFANGTGVFDGINTTLNGTATVAGIAFLCNGTGTYEGSGEVVGDGTMTGTLIFEGDGVFEGTGMFNGEGYCEGSQNTYLTRDRADAIAHGFPAAMTINHPSSVPSPSAAAVS